MNSQAMLRTVNELLTEAYFVPEYQRGYRWTETQVTDLLNDIYEFYNKGTQDGGFYCLQPMVIKKGVQQGTWNIVDGQQRLTTIILLTKYINEMWRGKDKLPIPKITYQTRENTQQFLDTLEIDDDGNVNAKRKDENRDFYHIIQAYFAIHQWVEKQKQKNAFNDGQFQSQFLHHTKVIWYEIEDSEDEITAFIRINSGKIPLTNAELIKALFLQSKNFNKNNTSTDSSAILIHRYEIAEDWDRIEHILQDNAFWYFVSKDTPPAYSRIEFIFNLIYQKETGQNVSNDDSLTTYRYFAQKNAEAVWNVGSAWAEIKNIFNTLHEWYEDYFYYHCIGYLIYAGTSIIDILNAYTEKPKDAAQATLKRMMKATLPKEVQTNIQSIQNIQYKKNSGDLHNFFVLYNILYLINTKGDYRFPFHKLKTEAWDIEHIDSQTENKLKTLKEQQEWLKYTFADFKAELSMLYADISGYQQLKEKDETLFESLYNKILEKLADMHAIDETDKDAVGNLTLLNSGTNRAYGNALFPTKRRFIIARDKDGQFIPLCTKNVFLKYYQDDTPELRKWTQDDINQYEQNIIETMQKFFEGA